MPNILACVIPGDPIAKKRPRFFRKGSFVGAYNDQQTEESRFLWEIKQQISPHFKPFEGPLRLTLIYVVKRPKAHFGTGKNANKIKPSAPIHCTNNKDLDNYIKFTLDCLNGVAFKDDRQVVEIKAKKVYCGPGEEPETNIVVEAL